MGSSITSILVVAVVRLLSIEMNEALGMSRMVLADGIMMGGGIAIWTGDVGIIVVTCGEESLSLSASFARTAFR